MLQGRRFLYLALVVCALVAGSPRQGEAEEEIRLGFIGPLSGELANFGNDERNASELAIEEINSSNYVPGSKLSVIYEDGKCSGKDAAIAAQKLVSVDKVRLILGGVCSGETLGAAPSAEKAKVLLFSVFSSHPGITDAGDYIFRSSVNDSDGARRLAQAIRQSGYKSVGMLSENTDYALELGKHFKRSFEEGEGARVTEESYNPGEIDFRPLILRLKSNKPEALFLNPQGGNAGGMMVKQIRQLNWDVPLYGTYTYSSPDAASAAGGLKMLEGVTFIDAPEVATQRGKDFLARYKQRFPAPQSEFEVCMRYDSIYLLADAIKKVGTDTAKIRDFLYALPLYEGTAFSYHFDKNGDVVGVPYALKRVSAGKVEKAE